MHGDALVPIGELARRTGLTVKTIRFYADSGIVAPAGRNPAGHRLYDNGAVARLALVRTLRALGLDLPTIRKIADEELSLPGVAAAHAAALEVQIQALRLQRSLLAAAAKRGCTPEELELMHRLATLSEAERRRLTGDFLGTVFAGLETHPAFAAVIRSMTPELPEDPAADQIQAWVELAELFQDPDFRAGLRKMVETLAAGWTGEDLGGPPRFLAETVRSLVEPALADGIEPTGPAAAPIVSTLAAHYARVVNRPDDAGLRQQLVAQLESMNDPRRDQYLRLLAVVNGWAAPDGLAPVLDWAVRGLRTHRG